MQTIIGTEEVDWPEAFTPFAPAVRSGQGRALIPVEFTVEEKDGEFSIVSTRRLVAPPVSGV